MVKINKLSVIQVYLPNSKFLKPIIEAKASNIVDDPEACYISALVEAEFPTLTLDHVETFKFPTFVKVPWVPMGSEIICPLLQNSDPDEFEDKLVMCALENIDDLTDLYTTLLIEEPDFSANFNEAIMEYVINHNGVEPDNIKYNFNNF